MAYQVANPRNIPTGVRILLTMDSQQEERESFEGDIFEPPDNMTQEELDSLVNQGFLVEVEDG